MEQDFLRYSCQVALPGFGLQSQLKLQQAKALVVGAGGLGCPAAQYLAAAGIGTIGIADFDLISISNLHRQILYTPAEAGLKKAIVACNKLQQQNPLITIVPHDIKITSGNVMGILANYHLVVDCTDNFETRYLLNDACVLQGKPVIYGAIYQYEGQVAVWNTLNSDGTKTVNYRDIFPQVNAAEIPNCAEGGVIPTIAGIVGCMQANEAIKYFTGTGDLLAGKILILDAQTLQSRIVKTSAATATNITALQQTVIVRTIDAADLRKGLNDNAFVLVDVRTPGERAAYNIGGLYIPLDNITEDVSYLSNGKPVVFYCASGKRSGEAVQAVLRLYPNAEAFSLKGGLQAWAELP